MWGSAWDGWGGWTGGVARDRGAGVGRGDQVGTGGLKVGRWGSTKWAGGTTGVCVCRDSTSLQKLLLWRQFLHTVFVADQRWRNGGPVRPRRRCAWRPAGPGAGHQGDLVGGLVQEQREAACHGDAGLSGGGRQGGGPGVVDHVEQVPGDQVTVGYSFGRIPPRRPGTVEMSTSGAPACRVWKLVRVTATPSRAAAASRSWGTARVADRDGHLGRAGARARRPARSRRSAPAPRISTAAPPRRRRPRPGRRSCRARRCCARAPAAGEHHRVGRAHLAGDRAGLVEQWQHGALERHGQGQPGPLRAAQSTRAGSRRCRTRSPGRTTRPGRAPGRPPGAAPGDSECAMGEPRTAAFTGASFGLSGGGCAAQFLTEVSNTGSLSVNLVCPVFGFTVTKYRSSLRRVQRGLDGGVAGLSIGPGAGPRTCRCCTATWCPGSARS